MKSPMKALAAFHGEQPFAAVAAMLMIGVAIAFASLRAHGLLETDDQHGGRVSRQTVMAIGALFIMWSAFAFASLFSAFWMKQGGSTFVAALWFIESMGQVGVTPHVLVSAMPAVLTMAAFAFVAYIVRTGRMAATFSAAAEAVAANTKRDQIAALAGHASVVEELPDAFTTRK